MAKYLIIRFSSIGDIVLTSPIIRCLKKQNEFNQIHFITKENFKSTLSENTYLDKIYTIKSSVNEVIDQLKDKINLALKTANSSYSAIELKENTIKKSQLKQLIKEEIQKHYLPLLK